MPSTAEAPDGKSEIEMELPFSRRSGKGLGIDLNMPVEEAAPSETGYQAHQPKYDYAPYGSHQYATQDSQLGNQVHQASFVRWPQVSFPMQSSAHLKQQALAPFGRHHQQLAPLHMSPYPYSHSYTHPDFFNFQGFAHTLHEISSAGGAGAHQYASHSGQPSSYTPYLASTSEQEPGEQHFGHQGDVDMSDTPVPSFSSAVASSRSSQDNWQQSWMQPIELSQQQEMYQPTLYSSEDGNPSTDAIPPHNQNHRENHRYGRGRGPLKRRRQEKKRFLNYDQLDPNEDMEVQLNQQIPYGILPVHKRHHYVKANLVPPQKAEEFHLRSETMKRAQANRALMAAGQDKILSFYDQRIDNTYLNKSGKLVGENLEAFLARKKTWGSDRTSNDFMVPRIVIVDKCQVPPIARKLIKTCTMQMKDLQS